MKKVMTALAVAATALLAFGDVQSGTSFEDLTTGEKAINALVGHTDAGGDSGDFYWLSDAVDQTETALSISNYVSAGTSTPIASRPAQFAGVSNSKYLHIDVSTPLSRTINPANAEGGPEAQAIGDGIYLDTLVQFTAADQVFDENALGTGDKIAIEYVATDDASNPITNFVIRAGYVANGQVTTKNYIMNPVDDFDVTAWHRLTVRSIANVGSSVGPVGFVVYLDGVALTYPVREAAGDSDYVNALNSTVTTYLYNDETHALLPSAVAHGATGYNTLTAVAFQGNGSIDDISFTSTKPSFVVEGTTVTIAWDAGVASVTVNDGTSNIYTNSSISGQGSTDLLITSGASTLTVTATYVTGSMADAWTTTGGGSINGDVFTIAPGAKLNIISMIPKYLVNGTYYATAAKAVEAAVAAGTESAPATVQLYANVSESITVSSGYVIIDLAGKTITGSSKVGGAIVNGGATLQIINSGNDLGHIVPADGKLAVLIAGGTTTISGGSIDGDIDFDTETPVLTLTGGQYAGASGEFYLNTYVAEGYEATYNNNGYFTVAEKSALTGWAAVLGEAIAENTYGIDDLAELKKFQANVGAVSDGKLATAGLTFKLTTDIELDAAWPGIGIQNGKDLVTGDASKIAQFDAGAFHGIFDGQNHTISGFQIIGKGDNAEGLDYAGFFNSTLGATIQNLKIQYAGSTFAADTTSSTKESGATFVGVAKNSTLRNLTTVAGTVSCSKGFGGIVGYLYGTTVDSCTNNVNMTSLANNKCGGIAMICQKDGCSISNCVNNGTMTTGSGEHGGILGYTDTITIYNCQNTAAYKMFYHHGGAVTLDGVIKGNATVASYTGNATSGLNFATVDGSVATFVADGALAAGNTYKVMATGATATFEFAAAGTIAFDTALATPTYAITAAEGLTLTDATEGTVKTYTAAAAEADWTDETIPAGTSAATQYPALADTALATADADKLTTWAKAQSVDFADVKADSASYVDAFLLNCAATADAVAAAKENFKLDITVNADGSVTVTAPEGYNVEPKIEGKQSLSDKTWHDKTEGDQFFRAVLDL